jgi:hypothetical protein
LTNAPYNNVKENKGDSYGVSRDKGLADGTRTSSKTIKMCFVNTKIEKRGGFMKTDTIVV